MHIFQALFVNDLSANKDFTRLVIQQSIVLCTVMSFRTLYTCKLQIGKTQI